MNSEYLYEFMVLAGTMNFSRAAEKLFITQSALSRHIKELETELGEPLFLRDSHSVELTAKGHIFLQEATRLNAEFSKMVNHFNRVETAPGRSIRIACASTSFGRTLREFLEDFERKNSQYRLDIQLLQDLGLDQNAQGCDLLFSPFEYHAPSGMIRQQTTLSERSSLATNMRIPTTESTGTPESFLGQTLLVPYIDELFCSYTYHKQYIERMTANKVRIRPVPNVETALLCVQREQGIALVPRHMTVREYSDIIFTNINDSNLRFSTFLYAKETLDYEFLDGFITSLSTFTQRSKNKKQ